MSKCSKNFSSSMKTFVELLREMLRWRHESQICWVLSGEHLFDFPSPRRLKMMEFVDWGRRGRKSSERLETNLRSILLNSSWDSNPGHWAEPTLELSLCRSLRRTNISLFRLFIFLYLKVIMSYYSFNIIIFYYALTPFKLPGIGQDQSKNLSLLINPFLF